MADTLITPDAPVVAPAAATIKNLVLDPDAVLGTRFTGPILSGAPDISPVAGIANLHKRFKILASNGTFSLPVTFPPSSILRRYFVQLQTSFNGTTPKINIGSTLNGVDIATVDVSVAPTQVDNVITSILGSTWTIYVSLAGTGITTGKATLLIDYSIPARAVAD